jgi:hypothetical protein
MTRKTTPYARKMQRLDRMGRSPNGAEWLNTIQRCSTYSTEPPPGGWCKGTQDAADKALTRTRLALQKLLDHTVAPADTEPHDLLAHAIGVALIRAIEIGGADTATNPALPILTAGNATLANVSERRRRTGQWGLAGPVRAALVDAVDVYAEILMNSSPAQMSAAAEHRAAVLAGKRQHPLITHHQPESA